MDRLSAIAAGGDETPPQPLAPAPEPAVAVTHPLEDFDLAEPEQAWATRPLEAITPPTQERPTRPLQTPATLGSAESAEPGARAPETGGNGGRRFWPLPGLLRRGGDIAPRARVSPAQSEPA